MSITIQMEDDFKKIPILMERLDRNMKRRAKNALIERAKDIYRLSQEYVPVVTGFLKSTGAWFIRDWSITVKYVAYYAKWVERGTRYFHGRFYLRRAYRQVRPVILPSIQYAINWAIKETKR